MMMMMMMYNSIFGMIGIGIFRSEGKNARKNWEVWFLLVDTTTLRYDRTLMKFLQGVPLCVEFIWQVGILFFSIP